MTGNTYLTGPGWVDARILKLDSNGSVQWQKTYGGSMNDWVDSIQQTSDGGYIVAGYTDSWGSGDVPVPLSRQRSLPGQHVPGPVFHQVLSLAPGQGGLGT